MAKCVNDRVALKIIEHAWVVSLPRVINGRCKIRRVNHISMPKRHRGMGSFVSLIPQPVDQVSGDLIGAIWCIVFDSRNFQQFLEVAHKSSVLKLRFADGQTMHVVFDKINQRFRFAILGSGAISEWNSGLVYFRQSTIADFADDSIRGID